MGCHAPETWGRFAGDVRWDLVALGWPWRLVHRLGFRAARLWWRLRRPAHDGAVVAVWWNGRVLAVQRSCRANPSWPGGGMRRGEEPREAARRELREDLGLEVAPDDLVFAREMVVDWDSRREHVRDFELRLRAEPVLRPDNREIVAARFVQPRAPLAEPVLPPFIRAYLGQPDPDDQRRPPAGA
jgi:8-oxo-dGTP diphosphatase